MGTRRLLLARRQLSEATRRTQSGRFLRITLPCTINRLGPSRELGAAREVLGSRPNVRRRSSSRPKLMGGAVTTSLPPDGVFVHPCGLCDSQEIGHGTRIWAFAHVLAGARIGRDCNICDGAFVENGASIGDRVTVKNQVMIFEGVHVGDDVFLGPGVIFTNDLRPRALIKRHGAELLPTIVQQGATLGAGVVVVCGVTLGEHAFIGAGAVVTEDVPAHGFVVGNPGRRIGWACTCGERLPADLRCRCGRVFEREGSGLRQQLA